MAVALPLNSIDVNYSAMKLCSNCTVFSSTRTMTEKVNPALLDDSREKSKSCCITKFVVNRIYFSPSYSFKGVYLNFPCVGIHGALCLSSV